MTRSSCRVSRLGWVMCTVRAVSATYVIMATLGASVMQRKYHRAHAVC